MTFFNDAKESMWFIATWYFWQSLGVYNVSGLLYNTIEYFENWMNANLRDRHNAGNGQVLIIKIKYTSI